MSVAKLIEKIIHSDVFISSNNTLIEDLTTRLKILQNSDLSDEVLSFHKVSALLHEFAVEIRRLEGIGLEKDEIIGGLKIAREIVGQASFLSRLQVWPRGYQGDFETIEYLCDGINKNPIGTLAYYIDKVALATPIVQQHKNKVQWQSQQILNVLFEEDANILSIGCGGCRDLRLIEPAIKKSHAKFVLNDIDEDALMLAENQLESVWHQITPILGDSFRKTRKMSQHGEFNLIVAGGLFDYLPDRYACSLLKKLGGMLKENGKICFTNILKPNPWSVLVEYLANWTLIERSEDDFQKMFDTYGLDNLEIKMIEDSTALAGLYELRTQN